MLYLHGQVGRVPSLAPKTLILESLPIFTFSILAERKIVSLARTRLRSPRQFRRAILLAGTRRIG
jgi:hypothetical protein